MKAGRLQKHRLSSWWT